MMRSPIVLGARDAFWQQIVGKLDGIEHGLRLVLESLDCSQGQFGVVDGLLRDAAGAPVLLLLAADGDPLLVARTMAAVDFLHRLGDALGAAVPEGQFTVGARGRVLVLATDAAHLRPIARLALPSLHLCQLEAFRLAGQERFAVRWLAGGVDAADAVSPAPLPAAPATDEAFAVPAARQPLWRALQDVAQRVDPNVRLDGDRYWRRLTWQGRLLGEFHALDGALLAKVGDGTWRDVALANDVRSVADALLRRFLTVAGFDRPSDPAVAGEVEAPRVAAAANGHHDVPRRGTSALRATTAAARLSPEEYSALGGPASAAGGEPEVAARAGGDRNDAIGPEVARP
jgi:hypothetical protein